MKTQFLRVMLAALVLSFFPRASLACEEQVSLSAEETKELRDKLIETGADPLDRLFAFETLACSDKPTIRAYAIKAGLGSASDPLVRNQIMFEALMQKSRIDVVMSPTSKSTERDKNFVLKYQGVLSRNVTARDRIVGCVAINRRSCEPNNALFIRGDTVEYNFNSVIGLFKLSPQNELVGYVIPDQSPYYSKIPAIIKLF